MHTSDEHVHNETEDDQDDEVFLEYNDKKHAGTMEANTDNSSRTDDGTLTTIKTARDNARRIFLESDPCPLVVTCQESIQTKSSKKGNETTETVNRESRVSVTLKEVDGDTGRGGFVSPNQAKLSEVQIHGDEGNYHTWLFG